MTILLPNSKSDNSFSGDKPIKILLAGLQNSGKSSICEKLSGFPLSTIERIATSTTVEYHLPQSIMKTVIWVPPGQEESRKDLHQQGGTIDPEDVFTTVDVFGFVIDSADRENFDQAKKELGFCLQDLQVWSPTLSQAYLLVHKQDLRSALSVEEVANTIQRDLEFSLAQRLELRPTSIYDGTVEKWLLEIRRKFYPYERHPLLKREIEDLKVELGADSVILVDGLGLPVVSSISDVIDEELICAAFSHLISGEEQYKKTRFSNLTFLRGKQLYTVYQFSEGLVFVLKLNASLFLFVDNPAVPLGMVVLHSSRASNRIAALI
ncbi:MAG: ADP-ribosylation factor-like protein [Candidatus Heimdallarchaeota archaeon]